jgi:hypothetical protein
MKGPCCGLIIHPKNPASLHITLKKRTGTRSNELKAKI